MKREEVKIRKRYGSKKNVYHKNTEEMEFEVIKKNKITCWVRLWLKGKKTKTTYKNVEYRNLKEL